MYNVQATLKTEKIAKKKLWVRAKLSIDVRMKKTLISPFQHLK